jgi:psiF repeat
MKLFYALAVTALLSSSVAFAQTTATAPDNAAPAAPTAAPTPANGTPSRATCRKQAKDKNLTGADKKQYVHDCLAGKAPS